MTQEEMLNYLIGKNVRYHRQLYNLNKSRADTLTQEKLAEKIGVSVSLISNLESEKTRQGVSIYNLFQISKALNAPIQDFFCEHKK